MAVAGGVYLLRAFVEAWIVECASDQQRLVLDRHQYPYMGLASNGLYDLGEEQVQHLRLPTNEGRFIRSFCGASAWFCR